MAFLAMPIFLPSQEIQMTLNTHSNPSADKEG